MKSLSIVDLNFFEIYSPCVYRVRGGASVPPIPFIGGFGFLPGIPSFVSSGPASFSFSFGSNDPGSSNSIVKSSSSNASASVEDGKVSTSTSTS